MAKKSKDDKVIVGLLSKYRKEISEKWINEQVKTHSEKLGRRKEEFISQCNEFFDTIIEGLERNDSPLKWLSRPDSDLRIFISEFAKQRILQGFTHSDTSRFILKWRLAFFDIMEGKAEVMEFENYQEAAMEFNEFSEELSLVVVELYVAERDDIIVSQQAEIMELSIPVIKVWDGVLALPIVGTLDSMRSQQLMENVLNQIVETGYANVIIDISGVPTIDTQTAQHLMKSASAIRLMGGRCIISGIRPEIASTMVGLGVNFDEYSSTKANMADAILSAIGNMGYRVMKKAD